MGPLENLFNFQRLMFRRDRVGSSQRDQAQRGRHHQLLQNLHQDSLPGATDSSNPLGRVILNFFNYSLIIAYWRSLRNLWVWPNLLRGLGTPLCKCAGRDFCQETTQGILGLTLAYPLTWLQLYDVKVCHQFLHQHRPWRNHRRPQVFVKYTNALNPA